MHQIEHMLHNLLRRGNMPARQRSLAAVPNSGGEDSLLVDSQIDSGERARAAFGGGGRRRRDVVPIDERNGDRCFQRRFGSTRREQAESAYE